MKHAFTRVDQKKQGLITTDNFFKILEIMDVILSPNDKSKCIFEHEVNGWIKYITAMKFLAINRKDESWEFRGIDQLQEKPFSKESKHRRMQTLQSQESDFSLLLPKKIK